MKVYGNPYRWTELWRANPTIENPDLIYAGNTLNIK
ncbi:LysM peptidoglycan-binding domain-containing protein [Candidatus Roizmanbacteria bacterium]|nr:MAG: LysM peptidoglycan-binding domain-containing protein [Candidatus Roizmanbacteria bacterium]